MAKTELIRFKTTEEEKDNIRKRAHRAGKTMSGYILDILLNKNYEISDKDITKFHTYAAAIAQDIYNYVKENYRGDKFLEEAAERLWESL